MKKFQLNNNLEKVLQGKPSNFLNPIDTKFLQHTLNRMHQDYQVFKPFKESEKLIIYKEILDISLLEIKCKEKLTHQEILGSLFSHNIEEDVFGDIIISNKYYIVVKDKIKDYFLIHYKNIGKKKITLEERNLAIIKNYKLSYKEIKLIISSLRVDNIISKLIPTSRSLALEMIHLKKITLNYQLLKNKNYQLKEGDIFSIRGIGKFKFEKIHQITKNKKYQIIIKKYI